VSETLDIPSSADSPAAKDPRSFEAWVDRARPKSQLWRTLLGVLVAGLVWAAWTILVMVIYGIIAIAVLRHDVQTIANQFGTGSTPLVVMIMLVTFLGMWLGVMLVLWMLHRGQTFGSLFSAEGRIRWREFGIGVVIILGYGLVAIAVYQVVGLGAGAAYRNDISIGEWLVILVPMAVLLFLQSSGEELVFRGYVMQHLAARFRHPLVWGVLPSVLFGAMHYANGSFTEYSVYYVTVTVLFGLIATVTVWRTGSISAAMGMHTANNFMGFMVAGTDDTITSTPLYLSSVNDLMRGAPYDMGLMVLTLAFVLSPLAPFPRRQLFARRKDTRAAP
jgi:uncharacterized protein